MPTTITHVSKHGITYQWTLNLDNVQHGVFWDGSPYVVSQAGLKVTNVQITSILGGVSITEGPCLKKPHILGTNSNGTAFYGNLYINGIVKNPRGADDYSPTGVARPNGAAFDSRYFGVYNRGWQRKSTSTDSPSSYTEFDLNAFLEYKRLIESGSGIPVQSGDVVVVAKSNYDPNDPGTFTASYSGGYPYQKHRNRSVVLGYGTLFVLATHPAGGGANYFRPPLLWPEEDLANRPVHALSKINARYPTSDQITQTLSGNSRFRPPSFNDDNFTEFCYGFPLGNGNVYSQMMPLYPAYGAETPGDSYGAYYQSGILSRLLAIYADRSNQILSEQNRLKILRCVVQWGIDAFGSIKTFATTGAGAGQKPCTARPWSIIAGWFLDEIDMRAPETTMLYGSYANREAGILTDRAIGAIDSFDGTEMLTIVGYGSPSTGGTDGYAINKTEWSRQVYGDRATLVGKKRRVSRITSQESITYFKVSGDLNESRILHYNNLGRAHRRSFGHGVSGSPSVTVGTTTPEQRILFISRRTNAFAGNLAFVRWSQNPFTNWPQTHAGKPTSIQLSYIRVVEDPASATSTNTYYRILKCVGDFRSNEPVDGYYTLYLDRPWVGATPSAYAKYEMVPFIDEDVGDIFYRIQTNTATYLNGFNDANRSPTTAYGGICLPLALRLYSWLAYAKRELNSGEHVDLDHDSTHAHELIEQITREMPYNFEDYNFDWVGLSFPWQIVVVGEWLNIKDPIRYGWSAVVAEKGSSGWSTEASGVTVWNGVTIADVDFSEETPPLEEPAPLLGATDSDEEPDLGDSAESGNTEPESEFPPLVTDNDLQNPFRIQQVEPESYLGLNDFGIDTSRVGGILAKQPKNTNPAFNTNFRLMIPKVHWGIYFCTEVNFPQVSMESLKVPVPLAPSIKFFGDKVEHGEMTVKFIVDDNYDNWFQMSDWFRKSLNYYGFFQDKSQMRMLDIIVDSGQLVLLNNKKNPVSRITFDGLMITGLTNMAMNSALADNAVLTCDATFQFTSFDIQRL